MPSARFDAGQDFTWQPYGFYNGHQSLPASPFRAVILSVTNNLFRVDYASLMLHFSDVLDTWATAEMSVCFTSGLYPAFLACSYGANTDEPAAGEQVHVLSQLSLPFYVTSSCSIYVQGNTLLPIATSSFDWTVSVSQAFSLG
jgi:hypothetical protein